MELTPLRPSPQRLLDQADVQTLANLGVVDPPTEPEVVALPDEPAPEQE